MKKIASVTLQRHPPRPRQCTVDLIELDVASAADADARFIAPPDMLVIRTTAMDENGFFNLGPTNAWIRTVVERAKTVI